MRFLAIILTGGFLFTLATVQPSEAGFELKPAPSQPQASTATNAQPQPRTMKLEHIDSDPEPLMKYEQNTQNVSVPKESAVKPSGTNAARAVNDSALMKTTAKPAVRTYTPPAPAPQPQKIQRPNPRPVKQMIINPYPEPQQTAPQKAYAAEPVTATQDEGEVVQGFGSDIPLAFALSQVVPAEYGYSFGIDVNPGYRVSWNGGRPWQTIVKDMIEPLDLMMRLYGNKLIIEKYDPAKLQQSMVQSKPQKQMQKPEPVIRRNNIIDPGPGPATSAPSTGQPQMLVKTEMMMEESTIEEERPLAPSQQPRVWKAEQGKSLRNTLGSWSNQVNVGMVWNVSHDFPVTSQLVVNGNYSDAVNMILSHGIESNAPITHSIVMHEGSDVVKTLIVNERS